MGDVVQFKRAKRVTLRQAARGAYNEAVKHVGKPIVVVVYAQSEDGVFAVRTVHQDTVKTFDALARAEAAIAADKNAFLQDAIREHEYIG